MFEKILSFLKKEKIKETKVNSKETAKERLQLVLMQDRANMSVDFLEIMKQEIIEIIKKYVDIDEKLIDVRLTNNANSDGTVGGPALYANIPIANVKGDMKNIAQKQAKEREEQKEQEEQREEEQEDKLSENEKEDVLEDTKKEDREDKKMEDSGVLEKKKEEIVLEEQGEQENKLSENIDDRRETESEKEEEIKVGKHTQTEGNE